MGTPRFTPQQTLDNAAQSRDRHRGIGTRVPVLMYHAVDDDINSSEAEWSVRPVAFEAQMRVLRDEGWTAVSMSELCSYWVRGESPPPRCVAVTFDDGHACLHDVAMPIMRRHGIRSTVFAVSGFLGGASTYDEPYGTAARAMMTTGQLRGMHSEGHEVGSHTVSHPDLRTLTPELLRDELGRSREDLECAIGAPVCTFAYPHGWFNRAVHDAVVQAGYSCAVSVMCGLNTQSTPRHLLRRTNIGDHTTLEDFRRILRYGGSPLGVG